MNKAMTAVLSAGAVLAAAEAAHAENWYPFYMKPSGVTYLDKDSLIYRPGHVSGRVQSTFPEPQHLQAFGQIITFTKSVDVIDIDCNANVYRFLARNLYNDAGVEQTSLNEADNALMIRDKTPEAVMAQAFCPRKR